MEQDKITARATGEARKRHVMRQRNGFRKPDDRHAVVTSTMATRTHKSYSILYRLQFLRYNWSALKVMIVAAITLTGLFAAAHLIPGHIFPNISSFGVPIGGLSVEEAEAKLLDAWHSKLQIQLTDGDRSWTATPVELGLKLDVRKTIERARVIGMAGIPFGYGIEPVVTIDSKVAQKYLTQLANIVNIAPYNAGYKWQDDQLIGVTGMDGSALDVANTLAQLTQNTESFVTDQHLDLVMSSVAPAVVDPMPFLDFAHQIATQPFVMIGYDPFTDETVSWTTTRDVLTSWLEAGKTGLALRREAFASFFEAQTASLNKDGDGRFLDPTETSDAVQQAIAAKQSTVTLRIRYHPTTYTVVAGDTGYRISRKTGIPFYLIQQANPGFDLSVLSPGDILHLPSRDVTVPLKPVANKRIVINLDTQSLIAYESGQQVFSWPISSGIEDAPTSPGIFQILSHEPVAYGSSYKLCNDTGCGQWQMQWFMGIYEIVPGLINGFHGAVLLPNGAYLGGGNVGKPYTLGCIMSRNEDAQKLYEWADEGTIVEIISSEFPPRSELARLQAG